MITFLAQFEPFVREGSKERAVNWGLIPEDEENGPLATSGNWYRNCRWCRWSD